ncbi:MAG: hypothetical protein H7336_05185 [Bacteriovorax sp.]|nr:hypothetical protein [Bacteriovorax sp.]
MKFLLTLALTGLSLSIHAAELDSIALLMPVSYSRPSSFSQTVGSKVLAGAANTFNIDIEQKVVSKIAPYKKDLEGYFSGPGELDAFVKNIVQTGIKKHLGQVTDDNLISFFGYLGNNLIGKLADKILEKEGVADPVRRTLWVDKLTRPFNNCIQTSMNSQFDANHCIDALTSSLVPSTGIGIVYELSRSNLNSTLPADKRTPFNLEQAGLYKTCISKTKLTATDVLSCALGTMKTGVLKVTYMSLTKTIDEKASSKNAAATIKNSVWPAFNVCTNNVGGNPAVKTSLSNQFLTCIDDLVSNTGTLIVKDKVISTPVITGLFSAHEVKKLSDEKSSQFKKCAEAQKVKGAKRDGMLDIGPCENSVTNEITYKVVSQTFRNTARDSLKTDKEQSLKVGNEGVAILDKCWDNKQSAEERESCLKKSIITYSQNVATIKLDAAIPKEMHGRTDLNKNSVSDLSKCLDKELPSNISESNDLTQRLGSCTGKLTRNVALKVADYQIRDTAKGNLSPEDTDKLVNAMVKDEFAKCIGNAPDDVTLEKCSNSLTTKAAKQITETSFVKEVNSYLKSAGGLEALGITQSTVDSFLTNLNNTNRDCIDQKTSGPAMDQVNACVKGSVKKIAFFFGDLKFNQSIGDMYKGRESDKEAVEAQFKKTLGGCLDTKGGKEFSIGDYTKNLYACSDKVGTSTTLTVGQDQVNTALDQYLKDRPEMDLSAKRDSIRKELLGNFQTCMNKNSNQNACIDTLKKGATKNIVVEYGRVETKAQMNADKTPAKLRPVEDNFIACTDSELVGEELAKHLDECTKDFALNFAKELGTLKLTYLLKQTLGTADFTSQKQAIDDSIAKYSTCLDDLKKYKMSEGLTDKLTVCTDGLTTRGLTIVRSNINNWMSSEDKDAATLTLKREFAVFLPCLSALIPASPYSQQLQQNIDSSIKPLAILLGHYIEYNPENAKQTLDGIISKLSVDLSDVAKTKLAKSDLLDFLYKSGALDQFLKAIVRGTVQDALAGISDKDVSPELKAALLKKQSYEEVFNTLEGNKIKDAVMEKILKPILMDNADTKAPAYKTNMDAVKDNVIKLLINSSQFGETAISMTIQKQMDSMGGITKFFAKTLYGGESLNWEKVRLSNDGKKAEAYIKENVLGPKFKGTVQTPEEQKKAMDEAQAMVTKAVKSHGKK